MSESYAEFQEADGSVRMAGQLAYPQATPSDVLTVQDDGTIAAETGGGSIPSWWTTDNTAGERSVSFGGTVAVDPDNPNADAFLQVTAPPGTYDGDGEGNVKYVDENGVVVLNFTTYSDLTITAPPGQAPSAINLASQDGGASLILESGVDGDSNTTMIAAANESGAIFVVRGNAAIEMANLPTSDPGVAGQLYQDGVTHAVFVSQG